MIKHYQFQSLVLLLLVLSFAGCGKNKYPTATVTGRVTCHGKPLANITVSFIPTGAAIDKDYPGKTGFGNTDENGEYEISTFKAESGDGAVIGIHTVALRAIDPDPKNAPACELPGNLTREVVEGSNVFNFELPLTE